MFVYLFVCVFWSFIFVFSIISSLRFYCNAPRLGCYKSERKQKLSDIILLAVSATAHYNQCTSNQRIFPIDIRMYYITVGFYCSCLLPSFSDVISSQWSELIHQYHYTGTIRNGQIDIHRYITFCLHISSSRSLSDIVKSIFKHFGGLSKL